MRYIKKSSIVKFLFEDYHSWHGAPDRDSGCAPLYDLTGCYPDDIYSDKAKRLYGDDSSDYSDDYSLWVIRSVRNRPNADVQIYRAVPDMNVKLNKEIKGLTKLINHYLKFGFFPPGNDLVHSIMDNSIVDYNERIRAVFDYMNNEREKLVKSRIKLPINNKDWVTINRAYAILHGKAHLNNEYKIITKTVKAKDLYSEGSSIHEFGYDPS